MIYEAFIFYILGGLTFLPLIIFIIAFHAYLTFPTKLETTVGSADDVDAPFLPKGDSKDVLKSYLEQLPQEFRTNAHEPDVAAGYFAVCREYVSRGVNGKPPERSAPAGAVTGTESPSVYQSMYRSIFDRNKAHSSALETTSTNAKSSKGTRSVFYIVLRSVHA
jgi:hypothetical protein